MNRYYPSFLYILLIAGAAASCLAQSRSGPFTNSKRSVRNREIDQLHIRLELKFDWDRQQIDGRAIHTLSTFKALSKLQLDAAGMRIDRVAILRREDPTAEVPLKFETRPNLVDITLDRQYKAGETFTLAIDYQIVKPVHGAHFVIPDPSQPDQPRMVWTQSEPEYARYWFPCVDSPTDRLTSEIVATVPAQFFVLSNGVLESKKLNDDGTQTWSWAQKKSHVPYLMSVVAGDFEEHRRQWDGIDVLSYVPRGRLADAERSFGQTADMLEYFSKKLGYRYPWPKYAQICVDEYGWGGMEHTSATTLNQRTLHDQRAHLDVSSDNLVAHELAHQWFGDLVTCKDWGELWLNESFATYFATLWQEHNQGWDEATAVRYKETESYLREDKRYRRSIVNYRYNTPRNMFDRHSYPKGGRVLHMLRFELGDDMFWRSLRRYLEVNQFRTVETADLRRAIEDATGQGMNWFFDQWLYHGGHPEFNVDWQWDEVTKTARVTVRQTQKVDTITPLFRSSLELELAIPGKTLIRRVQVSKAQETFHFQLDQRPTRVCFDPNDWILKELTFTKSKQELLDQLAHDEHLVCRIRAAMGLQAFVKDQDVQLALTQAVRSDGFWAVRLEAVTVLAKSSGDATRASLIEAALTDSKSLVRREAIRALGKFKHVHTRQTLRQVIVDDRSYYAVADALRSLVKVDRKNCAADLLVALNRDSHQEMILKAACDGLVTLKDEKGAEVLETQLKGTISPERRVLIVAALARLKTDDPAAIAALNQQLSNDRRHVRTAAINALVELGDPSAIEVLLARRDKEETTSTIQAIDEAVAKLRAKQNDLQGLRKQLEAVQKQNRRLESRLEKLEKASSQ